MPLQLDNYQLNNDESQSYQDFQQSCPQNTVNKKDYKKITSEIYFDLPVNYCPYLIFEIGKVLKNKLQTNCFQIEFDFLCMHDNQSLSLSISARQGFLDIDSIHFELEKYLRKINLENPIIQVDISIIESSKKLKVLSNKCHNKYNVFSSVDFKQASQDIYLGLVKLDLEPDEISF